MDALKAPSNSHVDTSLKELVLGKESTTNTAFPDTRTTEPTSGTAPKGLDSLQPEPHLNKSPTRTSKYPPNPNRDIIDEYTDVDPDGILTEEEKYEKLCQGLSPRSLYIFTLDNPLRKYVITCIKSKMFDRGVLCLILANCIFLAMDEDHYAFRDSPTGKVVAQAETVFVVLFTTEMVLKVTALGLLVGPRTYLRDGWNCLDFVVVILSLLPLVFSGLFSVSAVRTVRVLRPLRTVTGVEGMRKLVVTLLQSLPMLMDVGVLLSFAFFIFGIVGVQLFAERMRDRCLVPLADDVLPGAILVERHNGTVPENEPENSGHWTWWLQDSQEGSLCSSSKGSNDVRRCRVTEESFEEEADSLDQDLNYQCMRYKNPNRGNTSFDTIMWAWLTIFQCISLEGWVDVMYYLQDGVSGWVWVYFLILIVFGAFFAVNLLLAVLYVKFTEEGDKDFAAAAGEGAGEGQEGLEGGDGVPVTSWQENAVVRFCYNLQAHPGFEAATMALIVLNTIAMASEYDDMPRRFAYVLDVINYVLTTYFAVEMVVKLTGLGLRGYCHDRMNIFDGVVVVFSLLEMVLTAASGGSSNSGSLSVLRSFRLLRVFKLARSWRQLNEIIRTIFDSLSSISYLSLILLLFMFITALLGMQLFGYKLAFCDVGDGFPEHSFLHCPLGLDRSMCPRHLDCYVTCLKEQNDTWVDVPRSRSGGLCMEFPRPEDVSEDNPIDEKEYVIRVGKSEWPRHHFDTFYWSVVTIFQILTGENWNEVMYDGMRAMGNMASLYFLFVVVAGNYVLLNLFLAILLDNFGSDNAQNVEAAESDDELDINGDPVIRDQSELDASHHNAGRSQSKDDSTSLRSRPKVKARPRLIPELKGNSLGLLSPLNPVRVQLAHVIYHRHFEWFVIGLICISSVILAIDSPNLGQESPGLKNVLSYADYVFVALFTLELVLKVLVMGLVSHPGSYLRNTWNQLDCFIVVVGLFGMITELRPELSVTKGANVTFLRALRTFRALRPIRMASRAEGMKVVVNALFQSFPGIANVAFVCMLFYLIFGILGLSLLMGSYDYCYDREEGGKLDEDWLWDLQLYPGQTTSSDWPLSQVNRTFCDSFNGALNNSLQYPDPSKRPDQPLDLFWTKPLYNNFDNIGTSILTLVEIVTLEGWLDVMYNGVDAHLLQERGNLHPTRDNNPAMCLFFLLFIVVGSFFIWNLFVGVTIDKFNEMKEKQEGRSIFLTEEQRIWVSVQKLMVSVKPLRLFIVPATGLRRTLFNIFNNDRFDMFIMSMIMFNVVVMSMTHRDMTESWDEGLFIANSLFAGIFTLEAIVKLVALYPKQYFSDRWNMFDFVVVMLSLLSMTVRLLPTTNSIPGLNLLRIFRVARVFRLIPKAKGLRTLFQTLLVSLPALGNVGSVLFLFFFIFAVMGMNLFGNIKQQEFLDRHANFRNFPSALMVLFRMSTGEAWNGIMHDCMIAKHCILVTTGDLKGVRKCVADRLEEHDARQLVLSLYTCVCVGAPCVMSLGAHVFMLSRDLREFKQQYFSEGDAELSDLKEGDDYESQCSPDNAGFLALLFFWSFVILCAMVMLNLVIAVILENFQSENIQNERNDEDDEDNMKVGRDHVQRFQDVWSRLDPYSTYYIHAAKLTTVVAELDPPLGTRNVPRSTKTDIQNIIMACDIPNHDGKVHFYETLHALAGRKAGRYLPEEEEVKIRSKIKDRLPVFTSESAIPKYTAAHYHAALYVQAAVRGYLARYHMRMRLAAEEESVELGSLKKTSSLNNTRATGQADHKAVALEVPPKNSGNEGGAPEMARNEHKPATPNSSTGRNKIGVTPPGVQGMPPANHTESNHSSSRPS